MKAYLTGLLRPVTGCRAPTIRCAQTKLTINNNKTPADNNTCAAIARPESVGDEAQAIRIPKVTARDIQNPKTIIEKINNRPWALLCLNICEWMKPLTAKSAISTPQTGMSVFRSGIPPRTAFGMTLGGIVVAYFHGMMLAGEEASVFLEY